MDIKKCFQLGLTLMGFGLAAAVSLAIVYLATEPTIAKEKETETISAMKTVLPAADRFEKLSPDIYVGQKLWPKTKETYFPVGKVFRVSAMGYGGLVEMLVGINQSGKITGIQVLSHQETPGLGDRITKAIFLKRFIGKSKKDPIEPKVDIDAIAGATISTRAVCNGARQALEKF